MTAELERQIAETIKGNGRSSVGHNSVEADGDLARINHLSADVIHAVEALAAEYMELARAYGDLGAELRQRMLSKRAAQ